MSTLRPSSALPPAPPRASSSAANLPEELWIKILGQRHLTQYDLAQVRAVSRKLRRLADAPEVWDALVPPGVTASTWRDQANALSRPPQVDGTADAASFKTPSRRDQANALPRPPQVDGTADAASSKAPSRRGQANALSRPPQVDGTADAASSKAPYLGRAFRWAAVGVLPRVHFAVQRLTKRAAASGQRVPDLSALWTDARTQAHRVATAGWRAALAERDLQKAYPFFLKAQQIGKKLGIADDAFCYHPFYRDATPLALRAAEAYKDTGDVPRLKEALHCVRVWSRCLGQEPPDTATLLQNGLAIGIQVEIRAMIAAADKGHEQAMHVHHTRAQEYAWENHQTLPSLKNIWARGRENAECREQLEHARHQMQTDAAEGFVTSFEQAVAKGIQCAERLGERFVPDETVAGRRRLCNHRAAKRGRAGADRAAALGDLAAVRAHVREVNAWAQHGHPGDAFTAEEMAALEEKTCNACLDIRKAHAIHAAGPGDVNGFNKALQEGRCYARLLGKPFMDEDELAQLKVDVYRRGIACKSDLIRKHAPTASAADAALMEACLTTALHYAADLQEPLPHEAELRLLVERAKDRAAARAHAHDHHTPGHSGASHG